MSDDDQQRQPSAVLAEQLGEGNEEAASLLYQRFGPWLQQAVDRKIGSRLRRRIDAEDIMQSAFWSFLRRTADGQYDFEHSGALCRMLLTIAENKIRKAADFHQRERRCVDREHGSNIDVLQLDDHDWQRAASDLADTIDEIAHIVDALDPRDAEFFRRRYFLGHSAGRISAETGWSLATVKRVLNYTAARVRQRVEGRL